MLSTTYNTSSLTYVYAAESKPTLQEIEEMVVKYPDSSPEHIVKADIMRYGFNFTHKALHKTEEGYQKKTYYLFSYDKTHVKDMTDKAHFYAPEEIRISGGPFQLRPTCIKTIIANNSPYTVHGDEEGKLYMTKSGEFVANVEYRPEPAYYKWTTQEGRPLWDIGASICWGTHIFCTVLRMCQLWGKDEECRFCDINVNIRKQRQEGKDLKVKKTAEEVAECAYQALVMHREPENRSVLLTGGILTKGMDGKDNVQFYGEVAQAVKARLGNRWPIICQTIALNMEDGQRLYDMGVNIHQANLEVWDKDLFPIIVPGKHHYVGRDEWMKRIMDSVNIFGEGNVSPGIVCGTEISVQFGWKDDLSRGVQSQEECLETLMSHGVTPRLSQWTPEANSEMGENPIIPLEYFVLCDRAWYATWKKYDLPIVAGFGPIGPGRNHNINGSFMDVGY